MSNAKDILRMSWKEIEALPKDKTILFLTFAPVKNHGIHLPLSVNVMLCEAWKEKAIALISERNPDFTILTMPPVPLGYGNKKGFPGNLYLKQRTIFQVAYEILNNIEGWGIKNIVVIASRGEPRHLIAVEEACEKVNKKHGICAISPMGAFFSYKELGINLNFHPDIKEQLNKYPNDFPGGWIETSAIIDSHKGFPGAAGHLGKLFNENTAEYLYKAVMAFAKREDFKIYQHHSLYKNPLLRTYFKRKLLLILVGIIKLAVIYFIIWGK